MARIKHLPNHESAKRDVRGNFTLDQVFVSFLETGEVKVISNASMSHDDLAGIAIISEVLRRLRSGKIITYDFDPMAFTDTDRMVSCEWLPSGNLKLNMTEDGNEPRVPAKRWDHAYSIQEAMSRRRTFTCALGLYMLLPKRRLAREEDRDTSHEATDTAEAAAGKEE